MFSGRVLPPTGVLVCAWELIVANKKKKKKHLARANPFCQNQSPCPESIHSARANPLPAIHSCPIKSILPEPTQPSRAIHLARANMGRR